MPVGSKSPPRFGLDTEFVPDRIRAALELRLWACISMASRQLRGKMC